MNVKSRTSRQKDHVMGSQPPRPAAAPTLPHEHDERPEAGAPTQPVIRQAARDIAAGLVDTDNYTRIADVPNRTAQRGRRVR